MNRLLLLFIFIISLSLQAQKFLDPIQLSYGITPNEGYQDNSTATTDVHEAVADILTPVQFGDGNAWIFGVNFDFTRLQPAPDSRYVSLYSISPRIGALLKHNERWEGQYVVLPQIASDLKGSGIENFQLGGIAIWSYTKNEDMKWRLGAYYNSALYGPAVFIIGGFYHQTPNDKWTFDFRLPINADINYELNKNFSTGIHFDAMLRSYYLNEPIFGEENEYIVKSSQELYGYLNYTFADNLVLMFKFGRSFFRHYRTFQEGDRVDLGFSGININDNRTRLNGDMKDAFTFQVRLHYRFFLNQ